MALVSSNVNLEPYDGSRSQKSYNNIRIMLSMVYFHCKTTRSVANIKKSRSKISHFRPQKSEKSPAKSWRDCFYVFIFFVTKEKMHTNKAFMKKVNKKILTITQTIHNC